MTRLRRVGIVLTGSLLIAAAIPGTAMAAGSLDVGLVGTFSGPGGTSGPTGGVLRISGFADDAGPAAVGAATVSLCIPGVDPKNCLATITVDVRVPIDVIRATCSSVELDLLGFSIVSPFTLDGFTLVFEPTTVAITPDTDAATRSACALARQLDHGARDRSVVRLLNRLLGALA